jgi:adenylate kinase family enzyme
MSISPNLNTRLREILLRCDEFKTDDALETVFVDERISEWAAALPEANSDSMRVQATIEYLTERRNTKGENALVLFLRVIYDPISPNDALHQQLKTLADELEQSAPLPGTPQWEIALKKYRYKVQQAYGHIRIFGSSSPVPLDDFFTDIYILKTPTANIRPSGYGFQGDAPPLESPIRVPGLEFLRSCGSHHLLVLGKPGAGKTTFLRHLAVYAAKGKLNKIPVFVTLRQWVDSGKDLLSFVAQQFATCGISDTVALFEYLLEQTDDVLLLFDGLDEIPYTHDRYRYAIDELRDFSLKYDRVQYIITCRVAAIDYVFEHFTYVEIADFDDVQVQTFVEKWFQTKPDVSQSFLEAVNRSENRRLYELAHTPLLLGMLCLAFDSKFKFPPHRVEVYIDALEALLGKWDDSRGIKRGEIFPGSSSESEHTLLADIAKEAFEQGISFLQQEKLIRQIANYLQQTVPASRIDANTVLREIGKQHGILVERAHNIYSFSHLVFQEYYTARYIAAHSECDKLIADLLNKHVDDPYWTEVIVIIARLLDKKSYFFNNFLWSLSNFIKDDSYLVSLWEWADSKASGVSVACNIAAIRSYYLSLAFRRFQSQLLLSAHDFDSQLVRIIEQVCLRAYATALRLGLGPVLPLSVDLALDDILSQMREPDRILAAATKHSKQLRNGDLYGKLLELEHLEQLDALQAIAIEYRNIGHNWQFSKSQALSLDRYFYAIDILLECLEFLDVNCHSAIIEQLLQPPN